MLIYIPDSDERKGREIRTEKMGMMNDADKDGGRRPCVEFAVVWTQI